MSGAMAGRGRPGPRGPQGPMGPEGPQGPAAFSLAIGQVTAVPYGDTPAVTNVGTDQDQVWDIALVTGATGVLTGAGVPGPTDGTSLGQLYFCTANQTYYGLVELNENDNKWRPIMTQESALRKYEFNFVAHSASLSVATPGTPVGHVAIMLDDVKQKATVAIRVQYVTPAGSGFNDNMSLYRDIATLERVKADLAQRGISALPVEIACKPDGGSLAESTVDLLGKGWSIDPEGAQHWFSIRNTQLKVILPDLEPSGSSPGAKAVWKDGIVAYEENRTAAPGATEYGQVISDNTVDTENWVVLGYSQSVPTTYSIDEVVEVPYA